MPLVRRLIELACVAAAPRCRACGRPMSCEREVPIDPPRASFERTFVCPTCGERELRVETYGLE